MIQDLSRTNRCIAIDFRGWGLSSKTATDYELETLADDVIKIIGHLGLTNFAIIGQSMGGKVAQLVAARQPEGLKELVLLAPAPPTPLGVPEEQRRGMLASYQAREGAEMAIGILSALPLSDAYREQIIEDTLCGAPDAKRAWPEKGMLEDISAKTAGIAAPLHVIVGAADNIESEASLRANFATAFPDAKFTVIPGAGHLAPLEAPSEVAGAIRSALMAQVA